MVSKADIVVAKVEDNWGNLSMFSYLHVAIAIANHCKSRLPKRSITRETNSYYNVYLLQCSMDIKLWF